jgi:hypothetical protein
MMSRAKSSRLPLEKVPEEQHLQNLVYNLQTKMGDLQGAMGKLAKADMYVRRGNQAVGLIVESDETPGMARKVKEVVGLWMKTDQGKRYEVKYNFDNLLKSKLLGA